MKSLALVLPLLALPVAAGAQQSPPAAAETLSRVVPLPEVVVSTARADARTPVAASALGREELRRRNWGQDTPMALATLPGAYAYSDAGNGIGYSYLSVRGFPQRRISVLVNGVPLNDPESHEVYWIDHPDLLSSTSQVQLQRGIGSALYGAASVGGSVNLETSPFGESRRATAALAYGSFDTRRLMLEMDSGPLAGGWGLYGRYSRIQSDGYREQSWTRLWSYALSARKAAGAHAFRANLYGGPEETHLAYLGVPSNYLAGEVTGDPDRDRRYNPITFAGEADHFFEPHYELVHSWSPRPGLALTQTLFYFDGEGFYDERRVHHALADYRLPSWATDDSTLFGREYYRLDDAGFFVRDAQGRVLVDSLDLVRRRWVGNRHFGWIPRARIEHAGGALTAGGELRFHDGRHIGTVLGGQGLPHLVHSAVMEMQNSANQAWTMYPGLSHGAYNALHAFGTDEQKQTFLPKLVSGEWTGTMCLTEAHCGTDLGLLRTRAEPQADGSHRITGTKTFISSGEHDLTENIVHLVLARLPHLHARGWHRPQCRLLEAVELALAHAEQCALADTEQHGELDELDGAVRSYAIEPVPSSQRLDDVEGALRIERNSLRTSESRRDALDVAGIRIETVDMVVRSQRGRRDIDAVVRTDSQVEGGDARRERRKRRHRAIALHREHGARPIADIQHAVSIEG